MDKNYEIIFLVFCIETLSGLENLYEYFTKKNINTLFLVTKNTDKRWINNKDIIDYLTKKNIKFIIYNNQDIKIYKPKYIFYQSPYQSHYPKRLQVEKTSKIADICYTNYGYSIWSIFKYGYNLSFLKYVKYFFHENKLNKTDFYNLLIQRNMKNIYKNSYVTGCVKLHKYKLLNNLKYINVGWTPRWLVSDSTFSQYYKYLLNFFKNNSKNELFIRYHPLDINLKRVEFNNFSKDILNINIDKNRCYNYFFNYIDILISDLSSMISEFFILGKPIIYTYKDTHLFNSFGTELQNCLYIVKNETELENTLNELLKGNDILKEKRIKFIKKYYNYNSVENIKNILFID